MEDCHKDFNAFYRDEVALGEAQRTEMRQRRDTNRSSLRSGLERDEEPESIGSASQGSYAMRTMIQDSENCYDIDDGVYFSKASLVGPKGGNKTPTEAKEMVRKALHSSAFNTPVAVHKNCVRVQYNQGYHVDVPVYRKIDVDEYGNSITPYYELASTVWKRSDPLAVTEWFKEACKGSVDLSNGTQLRRVVRFLKKFAQSRSSWKGSIAPGFAISKLAVDNYRGVQDRDDICLRETMTAIRDALFINENIDHPVLAGEKIIDGSTDARSRFLRSKLTWALEKLEGLDKRDCKRADALAIWDQVFNTQYFGSRDDNTRKSVSSAAILKSGEAPDKAVSLGGDRRYG
jgi:hypothetical protein